jgi:hypothetical protein
VRGLSSSVASSRQTPIDPARTRHTHPGSGPLRRRSANRSTDWARRFRQIDQCGAFGGLRYTHTGCPCRSLCRLPARIMNASAYNLAHALGLLPWQDEGIVNFNELSASGLVRDAKNTPPTCSRWRMDTSDCPFVHAEPCHPPWVDGCGRLTRLLVAREEPFDEGCCRR